MVEGKAVALSAQLRFPCCAVADDDGRRPTPQDLAATEVHVTIGLFTIIKLFRLVNLVVESKGFCVPPECEEISPLNPCEFFDSLDFPLSIFDPPQKEDFNQNSVMGISNGQKNNSCKGSRVAGVSDTRTKRGCGCRD